MKKRLLLFLGLIMIILWQVSTVGALSVEPITIRIVAKPGESVNFKINFKSTEKFAENVKFSIAQPLQKLDGGIDFKPADPENFPESQWIKLSTSQVTIPVSKDFTLAGTVKIPLKARGFHSIAVLGEQPPQDKGAFHVAIVYAVRIDVLVDTPTPRVTAEVSNLELGKGPKNEPQIRFRVKNTSISVLPTNAYVSIRDKNSKKLVGKVELRPASFWNVKVDPIILPGNTLEYVGSPKEALLPGTYDIQLFFRYSTNGQIIKMASANVKEGDFTYPAAQRALVRLTPTDLTFSGKPGTMAMKGLKLENRTNKAVQVVLKPMDISADYPFSISKNVNLRFKNGLQFQLEPGRTGVAVMEVMFPKDAKVQGNYCALKVFVIDAEGKKLEESNVNLEAIVPGKYDYSAEATDVTTARDGNGMVFSVIVKNNSNVRINPGVTAYIKNIDGKVVDMIRLSGGDEDTSILPKMVATFSGNTDNIPAGQYKAEIQINQGSDEIGHTSLEIHIK